MLLRVAALLFSAVIVTGCTSLLQLLTPPLLWMGVVVEQTGAPPPEPSVEVDLVLTYGQTVTLPDMGLTLTFQEVLEDSRCPSDLLCVWSGWVRIALVAQAVGEPPATLEITTFTDHEGNVPAPPANSEAQPFAEYRNFDLALEQVTPYPARHADRPSLTDYQIRLKVRRQVAHWTPTPTPDGLPSPAATPTPVAQCSAAPQLPLLCYSNRAAVEYAAGVRKDPPMQLTAPVASCELPSQATGDALCAANWGEDWEMAEAEKRQQTSNWYAFLPTGSAYWMWDEYEDQLVAEER